eukprot:gene173-6067_t
MDGAVEQHGSPTLSAATGSSSSESASPSPSQDDERSVHDVAANIGAHVYVVVANSTQHGHLAAEASRVVCSAYGYSRLGLGDARERIAMGDAGLRANRVLHLAFLRTAGGEPVLVGACSSTRQPPWTPSGCGHWGLLSVAPAARSQGIGSALVAAAERRLCAVDCSHCQIEYELTGGDPFGERLHAWYEGNLGFDGGGPLPRPGRSTFRRCRKRLPTLSAGAREAAQAALHAPPPRPKAKPPPAADGAPRVEAWRLGGPWWRWLRDLVCGRKREVTGSAGA